MHLSSELNESDGTTTYFIVKAVSLHMQSISSVREVIHSVLFQILGLVVIISTCHLYSKTKTFPECSLLCCLFALFVTCVVKLSCQLLVNEYSISEQCSKTDTVS